MQASPASAQIHVFVIRDISKSTEQTGERDTFIVEPSTATDSCVRHTSCGARVAPSWSRLITTLGKSEPYLKSAIAQRIVSIMRRVVGAVFAFFCFWAASDDIIRDEIYPGRWSTQIIDREHSGGEFWVGVSVWVGLGLACVWVALRPRMMPNHSPDPTLSSGTSPAGQEPRPR